MLHAGDDGSVEYLEEFPVMALPNFKGEAILKLSFASTSYFLHLPSVELTGHEIGRFIIWEFEYGKNYSGPG